MLPFTLFYATILELLRNNFFFFLRLARETFPQIATFPFERRMQSGSRQNIKKQNGTSGSQYFLKHSLTMYECMHGKERK